jgi:tetratricopeptide (TPR) repeat protein
MTVPRTVAGTLLMALALLLPAFAQEMPAELGRLFEEGVRSLRSGDLDGAEEAFRSVIAGGGGAAAVHTNLGIVHQMRGRHEAAVAEFREAAGLDPDDPAPLILEGASLLVLARVDEAVARLEAAVHLAPEEALARTQLARAYERSGEWAGAVDQYLVLRKLAPEDPEHLYGLGRAYLRLSEATLRRLHRLAPDSARSHQARAHSHRLQGRPELALQAFAEAARADPTLPEIHLAMAQIHMEQKRWDEARRELERERALVPASAGVRALEHHLRALEAASR